MNPDAGEYFTADEEFRQKAADKRAILVLHSGQRNRQVTGYGCFAATIMGYWYSAPGGIKA